MSSTHPVALYAVKVPPGGIMIPAGADASAMFRVTMAAIDPDAPPEFDAETEGKPPRATLKIVRPPPGMDLEDDSDDDDYEDGDEDEDMEDSEDESNGGPSDPAKLKQARQAAASKDSDDDGSDGEDVDLKAAISKLIKGKDKATGDDDSDSDVSEGLEMEEVVVCTLDPTKTCQQPLDFVVGEHERIFFKVTGTHSVYITGNYVMPSHDHGDMDDSSDEEDEYGDYDLSPDEDELDLMDEDEESDELDDMDDPRITEIDSDEEEAEKAAAKKKGKKRPAEDSGDEGANLDDLMSKALKSGSQPTTNGVTKLSKKQQKKLKKNNGEAVEIPVKTSEPAKSDKKVQFAKKLEQGPTPSPPKKDGEKKDGEKKDGDKKTPATGTLGVKEVQGVILDDRKLGSGRVAKKGDRVSMRYIGKLENGKVFDANKKGPPFSFKLGNGEVIKGWDIGIPGMSVGGERRVTIPSHLAYGKQSLPGIPANSKLIFDVKLLDIK
ncbi:FK506-binding protein 1A [Histoplasma capsulatum var. duboisii H88]|uniref:peptidylprolyl isomerase n=2 Tax=Ajellomyces capsulatus TaxID=5037 RepID=F0UIX0_AJEC8|nr:FK506-binding protein [Histoplasma capsulatum H143]EGC46467.1 FK506-binding protein 1A [Histoplasma capsulatum var. duboisii H88]QSS57099.1 FK506-binding protein 1A [Histoplasma capsulatum var. duboisii H88]